ncbi:MAG TPA: META domain-containing protein, partial [Roseiflexaceae bacterium]|nr:META domain-containing protein [Roseiflexaceae bacterium]
MRKRFIAPLLAVLLATVAMLLPAAASAQAQRCFSETGFCISGPIRTYWERNGGLSVFGYPIAEQRVEQVEDRTLQVQWFERDRLEIQADGTITAGRLGARFLELQGRPWESFPKETPAPPTTPECRYFAVTGFNVCLGFRTYWERNGGLERFGYPISSVMGEMIEGKIYSVQYFERRRLEVHPENNPPYDILLGLLGREVLNMQGGANQPPTNTLVGTSWQWVKLTDPTQMVEIQDRSNYTLTFADATNLSIKADCNQVQAAYKAGDDGALSITLGPSTLALCPPNSRSDQFTKLLAGAAHYFIKDGNLFIDLMADGGTLEFEPAAAASQPPREVDVLSGTNWRWVELSDPTQEVEIQNPDAYTISFKTPQVSIKADCNQVQGSYSVGANQTLKITPGPSTRA